MSVPVSPPLIYWSSVSSVVKLSKEGPTVSIAKLIELETLPLPARSSKTPFSRLIVTVPVVLLGGVYWTVYTKDDTELKFDNEPPPEIVISERVKSVDGSLKLKVMVACSEELRRSSLTEIATSGFVPLIVKLPLTV